MSSGVEEGGDLMAKATEAANNLYVLRDTYFPPNPQDKLTKLRMESDAALKLLDSIPPDQRKLPLQRATYEYLRGKILDVFPDYRKEAEDHLSKAVKLNPSLADAWLCLGSENQAEMVEESIKHAKEAIALDVKDGNSWYNLGNACLTSFFVTGAWDHGKLLQSLKAYQNAEKDERMKSNPDLYFNCATVNKYLENYERALSGFEAAALKDPGLNASDEVHKKAKRLASMASSLTSVSFFYVAFLGCLLETEPNLLLNALLSVSPPYRRANVDALTEGLNKAVAVVGKVLFFVKHDNVAPLYYLVCDSNQTCFVLSVYGMSADAIKEGDQLILLDPIYRFADFSWRGKSYQFKSIRVDFLNQLLLNGKPLSPSQAVRASIHAQHKP
ncbi:hypothetical protein CDL15_Pgr011082 [Punica granatum]|uniref:Tetratricopeptide repeat protein 5 OB fold domain-containing protein n=1 Tax=Punica granatum TaxID=22663 RepID=A0A218XNA4_PUNGR|nr:hypothetical protein CDL15_Pgr011082 [Punica granatum]